MSVERCPSCGRTWDGKLCFACGHEVGKAVRASASSTSSKVVADSPTSQTSPPPFSPASLAPPSPSTPPNRFSEGRPAPSPGFSGGPPQSPGIPPTFARSPTPGPQFAPLPPLPALGRTTTVSTVGPTLPLTPSLTAPARADTRAPFPGASPSSQSQWSPSSSSSSGALGPPPSSFSAPLPQIVVAQHSDPGAPSSTFNAPLQQPRDKVPLPPMPPVQPRSAQLNAPRAAPSASAVANTSARSQGSQPSPGSSPQAQPQVPSSAAAAASHVDDNEQTAEVDREVVPRWRVWLRRFYFSPAVFGLAFLVGFGVMFGVGGAVFLREPSLALMFKERRYTDLIEEVRARRDAGRKLTGAERLLYGHTLKEQYGLTHWEPMLEEYRGALKEKVVDATALDDTMQALSDATTQKTALELLAIWPASRDALTDPTTRLAQRVADESFVVRHAAVEALMQRQAPVEIVDDAIAACALQDIKARTCQDSATRLGLDAFEMLIEKPARVAVSRHDPRQELIDLETSLPDGGCVKPEYARKVKEHAVGLLSKN